MIKSNRVLYYGIITIAVIAMAAIFSGYSVDIDTYAETTGPQIDYVIGGAGWTSSKLVTITVNSVAIIDMVLINGLEATPISDPDDYYKEYEYDATSAEDIIISATDVNADTNIVTIQANELYIDTSIPEFTVAVTGVVDEWTSNNVTLTFTQINTVNSGYTYYHSKDGGAYGLITGNSITYSASSMNGEYSYKAVSGSGINYYLLTTYDIMIDKTAPNTPSATFGTSYYTNLEVEFDLSLISDGLSAEIVYYTINGTRPNTSSNWLTLGAASITFPSNGSYSVRLIAIDEVGNESAVRTYLVKVDDTDYVISFDVSPLGGGVVTGAGTYKRGDTVNLITEASDGYIFRDITLSGDVISYDNSYSFVIDGSGNKTFTANFIKILSITSDDLTFTYDGAPKPIIISEDSGEDLSLFTQILYSGSATAPTNAGVYNVIVTIDHVDYYGYKQFELTINKASATISVEAATLTQIYGNIVPVGVTVTVPPAGTTLTILYNGSTSLPVNVGVYPLTITVNSDNYYLLDESYQLEIIKANVSIILSDKTVTYNNTAITVNPATTVPGSLVLTYNYYSGATLLDNPPVNAGVYTVQAVFNGNASYNAGNSNIATLTINKKQLTITGTTVRQAKTYDGDNSVDIITTGDLVGKFSGNDVSVQAIATYNTAYVLSANIITVVYSISGDHSDNYITPIDKILQHNIDGDVKINPLLLEVDVPNLTDTKIYDGNRDAEVTAGAILNKVGADLVTVSATALYDVKDITATSITITYTIDGDDSSNYITPLSEVINGIINARPLTVTGTTFQQIKIYDGNTVATILNPGTLNNVVSEEVVGFSVIANYNSSLVNGADRITATYTLTGVDKGNYIVPVDYIVIDGINAEIVRIDKLQLIAQYDYTPTKIYDGNTDAASAFVSFDNAILNDSVTATTSASYNSKDVLSADQITIVFTLDGDHKDNYITPVNATVAGNITPRKIIMNNPNYNNPKVYDKTTEATALITNNGATNTIATDDIIVTHSADYNSYLVTVANTIIVSYSISGADEDNYIVPDDYNVYDVEILPLQLTVDGNLDVVLTKIYDSTTIADVTEPGNLNNVIPTDTVSFSLSLNYNTKSTTASSILVVYTLDGDDKDNYIAPINETIAGASITPFALNIASPTVPPSKIYDGNISATVTAGALTNLFADDIVNVVPTGLYNSKDVLSATTVTVTYLLQGDDAINYTLLSDNVAATITPRQLLMAAPILTPKTYDGNNAAKSSVNIGVPTNKITGDIVNLDYTAVYDDHRVAQVTKVTVGYTITGGAQASNYSAPGNYEILNATINKKLLTASGTNVSTTKVYDGNDTATVTNVGTLSGTLGLDVVTLNATAKYNSTKVANANRVTVTYTIAGVDESNYAKPISYDITSGVSMTQLLLTINDPVLSLTKVYDGVTGTTVTAGSLINKIGSDSVTITAVANFNTANITANSITVVYSLSGNDAGNYYKPANKVYNTGVSITPLAVVIDYTDLLYTYDGVAKAATATIVNYDAVKHAAFSKTLLYQDENMDFVLSIINAGTYRVTINMATNTNYTCTSYADLIISPAQSIMIIDDLFTSYTGSTPVIPVTVTNNQGSPISGVTVVFTYYAFISDVLWESIDWTVSSMDDFDWELIDGASPARAGVYKVMGSLETGSNYSAASSYALLRISKIQASVIILQGSLTQPYGSVVGVSISTNPNLSEGNPLGYIAYYNGQPVLPTNAGSYSVGVVLDDYNYYGSASATFTVTPRLADDDIVLEKTNLNIDGNMIDGFVVDYNNLITYLKDDFRAYVDVEGLESLEVTITFKLDTATINNIHNAGIYQIIATIASTNITGTVTASFVINKILGSVTHTPQTFTYTGGLKGASGAVTDPFGIGITYSYALDGINFGATPPINIGTYPIKLEINDINYYGEAISSITVNKASTTIILPTSIVATYTGAPINLEGQVTFSEVIDDQDITYLFKLNDNVIEGFPINAGMYSMQVSFTNRDNFINPDSIFIAVTINKVTPSIYLENKQFAYDGTPKTIPALIVPFFNVELLYEYYSATYDDGVYTKGDLLLSAPVNVGYYIVIARIEDGGDNFTAAVSLDAILIINQGVATITTVEGTLRQIYNGEMKDVLVTTDPPGINVIKVYYQNSVEVDPITPGDYQVIVTIDDPTYEGSNVFLLTIEKQDLGSLIIFTGNTEVTYNGTNKSLTPSIAGYSVTGITVRYNGSTTLPKNAGTYNVVATINSDVTLYKGQASTQLIITKKVLSVQANNASMVYGFDGTISLTYNGFEANDTVSSLSRTPVVRISNDEKGISVVGISKLVEVGQYQIMPEAAEAVNYTFTYLGATLTITKAPLTVTAMPAQSVEGVRAIPTINYTGWKYNDDVNSVFGINRPIIKYYENATTLNSLMPISPGVYDIIPDGGITNNYTMTYVASKLTVLRKEIASAEEQVIVKGAFHPNAVVSVTEVTRGNELYKPSKKAVTSVSSPTNILIYQYSVNMNVNINGEQVFNTTEYEYRLAIPEKLQGKEFTLILLTSDGKVYKQDYSIAGDYVVGNMVATNGTLIFARPLKVMMILIITFCVLLLIGAFALSKYLKRRKEESPKELSNLVAPVVVAPLEALEDEDAAFDAYIERMVEENTEYRQEAAQAAAINKDEDEIDLGVNEEDYTPEELDKLREKARKARHLSVEERINEEIERQLVASFSETKRDVKLQEFTPTGAGEDNSSDDAEITDEYIIQNEIYPNSNTVSMEEAQALYPGRGIRRYNGKVALEVCFESALNLADDKYKYIYSEIKNTFASFSGVESRMFKSGEAFKGGNVNAVIRIRNEAPIIFMNIDRRFIPDDARYVDHSDEPKYKDMPIEIVVDDGLQLTAARKMISAIMVVAGLTRNPDYRFINYINKYPKIENAIIDEA